MTSPNHIVAGTFFTGFWCSFWNVNIFSRWELLTATIICSLLPDIDHPKSPIGILFYPLAKWLNRKYGHRTITHSLFFLFGGTLIIYFSVRVIPLLHFWRGVGGEAIFFFAVLSHLITDMITVQGVPLFYPIKRNPCVIPGNQDYRLISGKAKSEITAFLIFVFMNFLCWDLYAKGFWTNYNEIFTTIEHLHYERANSPNFTIANYNFIKNNQEYKGRAVVLNSSENKCDLLINDTVFKLDYSTPSLVVKSITAEKTNFPYSITDTAFIEAPIINLNRYINGKIVSGNITSNEHFTIFYSGTQKVGNNISLTYEYNVSVTPLPKPAASDKSNLLKQLAVKKQSLAQHRLNFEKTNAEYFRLKNLKADLQNKINNTSDPSLKNTLENELIKLHNKLLLMSEPVYTPDIVGIEEIKQLGILINKPDSVTVQTFTANISIVNVPAQLKRLPAEK